jgi:Protein of unknown function DUF262
VQAASAFDRTPSPQRASWFLDLNSSGQLDLNPPYQRRSVWNDNYRQFFIDSVIRNYPTQSIFLEIRVDPDGPTKYQVIDGKQRLTALIKFTQNEFPTPDSLGDLGIADTYYTDLPTEYKHQILGYIFTVEHVENAKAAELNQAFDRLNRNVIRLNKQELRHAQYGGDFATKMEKLVDDPFWEEIGLVTAARRRRMLDVEHISELYVLTADGIQDGKDYLDQIYSDWDDLIPNERQVDAKFRRTRKYISEINHSHFLASSRFSNVADFYSLWAAITNLEDQGKKLPGAAIAVKRLTEFQAELEEGTSERSSTYRLAARQGSNKSSNRSTRARILESVLIA